MTLQKAGYNLVFYSALAGLWIQPEMELHRAKEYPDMHVDRRLTELYDWVWPFHSQE